MKAECMGGPLDGVTVELPDAPRSFIFTNIIEDSEPVPGSDILSIRVEVARFEHVYQIGRIYHHSPNFDACQIRRHSCLETGHPASPAIPLRQKALRLEGWAAGL